MDLPRTGIKFGIGLSTAALVISAATYAQAASTAGWRRVLKVHYGAPDTYSAFWAVAALSTRDAWAVGGLNDAVAGQPAAYQWRGKGWHASLLPHGLENSLNAISAPAAKNVWAVSDVGGYILHYNGSKWSVAKKRFSGFGELTGVTAFSARKVWVFGGPGAYPGFGTWRYNGSGWKEDQTATKLGIVMASPLSRSNMWAIGSVSAGADSIFHYTGSWREAKASALSGLQFQDILALGSANVWAAAGAQANAFRPFLVHLTRRGWSRIRVPWPVSIRALAADGRGGLFLTAQGSSLRSWVLHRSKTGRWSRTLLTVSGGIFGLARIPRTTSLWATGTVDIKAGANATIWAYGRIR